MKSSFVTNDIMRIFSFISIGIAFIMYLRFIITLFKKNKKANNNITINEETKNKYKNIVDRIYYILINDKKMKKMRIKYYLQSKIGIIFIFLSFCPIIIFGLQLFVVVIYIIGIVLWVMTKFSSYPKKYKENIVKIALNEYDDKLEYYPTGCIPEELYKQANFEFYDRYRSEDRINGNILGHEFIMADVHLEARRKDSDGDVYYVSLFNGPVVIVMFPNFINFDLRITNNSINLFNNNNLIEIDNPEFEEIYDVYTNDPVKAMVALTPAVTKKIIDLYKKHGYIFEFKFVQNYMFFRFHSGNLFVPNAKSAMDEAIGVTRYFEIIDGIKEIMEEVIKATESVRK